MSEQEILYLIARIATCAVWTGAGLFKLFHFHDFAGKMKELGFPLPPVAAVLVLAIELIGSVLMLLDIWAWAVAVMWIGFTVWATWLDHRHVIDKDGAIIFPEYVQIIKNLSIIGGLICIVLLDSTAPEWLLL